MIAIVYFTPRYCNCVVHLLMRSSHLLKWKKTSLMQCWYCLFNGTLSQHNAITDCPNLCNSVSSHYLEACQLVCLFCKRESEREENIQIWLSETKSEAKGHTGSANTGKHSYADITDINGWIWTAWFKDMSQAEYALEIFWGKRK